MRPTTRPSKEATGIKGAVLGLVLTFFVLAGLARLDGLAWTSAAGIAALPSVFGGWYFGVILALAHSGGLEDTPDRPGDGGASADGPAARPEPEPGPDAAGGSEGRPHPLRPAA
jgi:hypothetical protein